MLTTLKRLSLGIVLIVLASSVLLVSDWNRRQSRAATIPHIAVLQNASVSLIDEGVAGMLAGLRENGFIEGESIIIQRYNAAHDMPTLNAIAKEITTGQFDLVLTASTPALQAVANANQMGKTVHIFGIVADPFSAGVGIRRGNPLDHPPYLTGFGVFVPVEDALRLAKKLFPGLVSVGKAWNPSEANSEACTLRARAIAQELGIELVEATVENSAGVLEATSSLIARDVQALWVGCDSTVQVGVDLILRLAKEARIPVFSTFPGDAQRGTIFGLGADFYEVGKLSGTLAARVLQGTDPATIPVESAMSQRLVINTQALRGVRDRWRLPDEVVRSADIVIDETGVHEKAVTSLPKPPAGRLFKIGIVYFGPDPGVESGIQGLLDGLQELGFVPGHNLEVHKAHAQGEIAIIPQIFQNYISQDFDLLVPLTTPCLTAACSIVKKKPVVFTVVYDPIAAGAGTTRTDHLPNITGVGSFPPLADTIDLIQQLVPGVQSVGTLYNSSEANSRKVMEVARPLFAERGIALEEIAITSTNEVFQAAQVLSSRGIQAMWITGDNTALQAFEGIVKVAQESGLPLIINDPEFTQRGALACSGIGFYHSGYAAAKLAARVLLGQDPRTLPIEEVAVKTVSLNFAVARSLGITFPTALIQKAERFVHLAARYGRPARIAFIQPSQAQGETGSNRERDGLLKGLAEAGLVKDTDFVLNAYQGATSEELSRSLTAIRSDGAEIVLVANETVYQQAKEPLQNIPILGLSRLGPGSPSARSGAFARGETIAPAVAKVLAGLPASALDVPPHPVASVQ